MKKSLLLIILLPLFTNAQTSVFAVGGIGTNTFHKSVYQTGYAFAPMAEVGFYNHIYSRHKIGMTFRYNSFNVMGEEWMGEAKKEVILKNVISIMFVLGGGFKVGVVSMYISGNGGLVLADNKQGFALGWRYDVVFPVTKILGITLGTGVDYYKVKNYKSWYSPVKAGIDIKLFSPNYRGQLEGKK